MSNKNPFNSEQIRKIWPKLLAVYGPICQWCFQGIDLNITEDSHLRKSIDHIVPLSEGGSNNIANLQPMHKICNEEKSGRKVSFSLRRGQY